MFQSATFRLTLWYLAILMTVSIFFSVALWVVSTNEVHRSLDRPQNGAGQQMIIFQDPTFEAYRLEREQTIERNIEFNLGGFNVIVLLAGGGASFFLARRTLRPIEAAMEAQGRFTADASHELRTPLTSMKTEIEVALREKKLSEPEAKNLLRSNLEEVTKLEALSNNLLRLAQYGAGQRQVQWDPANIKPVVDEALGRVRTAAHSRRIKLADDVHPFELEAQPESLTELLVILLDNAVKYGRPDTAITVTASAHGSQAELRVRDEGIGITPDDLPHIFDRFYRADSSRSKQNAEGYGLGLSIAKQIAELHHGHIEAESALGYGTTFIVRLPLKQSHRRLLPS